MWKSDLVDGNVTLYTLKNDINRGSTSCVLLQPINKTIHHNQFMSKQSILEPLNLSHG